jgi:hypothetical protein
MYDLYSIENDPIPIGDLTNTGGTLGKCLADIKKYSNASDFLKDLSQRAILAHSL